MRQGQDTASCIGYRVRVRVRASFSFSWIFRLSNLRAIDTEPNNSKSCEQPIRSNALWWPTSKCAVYTSF